ncbi:hydroxyquinol 1,2-dioxygenase [Pseudomonas sp. MAFF 301449]|uniref:Hydroxyquinol 1,2-dioxygenase n=1 Tax=Pseudomonas cyclaminis TaxID=2781239 RepID=A0ABR9STJ9_9PSED|nr:dioxygenase [Pseudomonas cyclaminis]MBE8591939.1 hydroxyquinol 1,2-dioxygenase [Pseudomonas cyclaminis]MBE8600136.1 hydroxyquinol 1,2-dioxygenase [Pseudomonas cyclaminis]
MAEFDTAMHLQEVLDSFNNCKDARFKEIMTSIVRHLHTFVAEVKLSPEEWISAIKFLTATGAICTDKRQEFILLSDLLGMSTLTIGINQHRGDDCLEETVEGPYYWEGAPELPLGADISNGVTGEKAYYYGKVLDADGRPVANALLDVWSGDGDGNYDMQLPGQTEMFARGKFLTDAFGRYSFWSIKPSYYPIPQDGPAGLMQSRLGRHPNRPGHIHFKLSAEGFRSVNTQLFIANGPFLNSDCVYGVKPSLIIDYVKHPAGIAPDGKHLSTPYYSVPFDFRLTAA